MTEPDTAVEPADRPDVNTALVLTGLIGAVLFAALLVGSAWVYDAVVDADGVSGLDRPVLDWMISQRTPASALWVTVFTNLGRTVPMVVIATSITLALYLHYHRRTIWVLMLVAAGGSISFTLIGKPMFGRVRPPEAAAVAPFETDFSFPSGHTLNSTVVAGMLAYLVVWLTRRTWLRVAAVTGAVLWAVAMGLSRVFLGHHWLTDVMFAWLFGLAWLTLLITAHRVLLHLRPRPSTRAAPISLHPGD